MIKNAEIKFKISGLSLQTRLIIVGAGALIGILLQVFGKEAGMLAGTILMILPLPILSAKTWTNKPKDKGEEEWVATGDAELDRIADAFSSARKIKIPLWYRPGFGIPFSLVLAFLTLAFRAWLSIPGLVFLDMLILWWPVFNFLKIRIWIPKEFEMIMQSLQAVRSRPLPAGFVCTPYVRLDRDDQGLRIPESARLMIEPKHKPLDLIGAQMQAAINKGPNGQVPYLYSVILTKGKGTSWSKAAAFRAPGYEVEAGGDENYGTVVIRQKTGGGGYHTKPDDCRRLLDTTLKALQTIAS